MRVVWALTPGMVRRSRGGFVLVAVILALGLGFSTTAVAGARRSDTAYRRLRTASRAPDVIVDSAGIDRAAIGRLQEVPGVRGLGRFTYTPVTPAALPPGVEAGAFVGLDPDFLTRVYRPFVVSGRLARPDDPTEVVVNEELAHAAGLTPGRRIRLESGFEQRRDLGPVTVVGVVRGIFDVGANAGGAAVLLHRSFLDAHRAQMDLGPQPAMLIRLRDPVADLPRLRRALEAAVGHPVLVIATDGDAEIVDRFLTVQTIGLLVLAAAAFVASLVAALQALSRQFDRAFADLPALVVLGLRPRQRYVLGAVLAALVAVVGGLVGLAISVLASPVVPTGFARKVDPASGVQIDLVAVGLVTAITVVLMVAAGALAARRHRWTADPTGGRAHHETRIGRSLPLVPRLGLEAALAPTRAPAGAAARAALVAASAAVAGIVAVAVFGTSLTRLLDEPRLQGWAFDAAVSQEGTDPATVERALAGLDAEPGIARHTVAAVVEIETPTGRAEAYAFDRRGVGLHPTIRTGRVLRADDEIVAGRDALRRAGLDIGDTVVVRGTAGRARLRVVGSATYPELGNNSDLASGLSITRATADRIGATPVSTLTLVRFDGRAGPRTLRAHRGDGEVVVPFRAPRVRSLEDVGAMPAVLAAFLGTIGLLAVAHALWRSSRERRRDFALLATLGLARRGLRGIVGWQSVVIAGVGVALGVPLGLLAGRAAWSAVADATGVVDDLAVPGGAIVALAATAIVVTVVVGRVSARRAIRPNPAVTLREA